MSVLKALAFLLASGSLLAIASCAQPQASNALNSETLLGLARKYGQRDQLAGGATAEQVAQKQTDPSPKAAGDDAEYEDQIEEYLAEKNFDQIDTSAREARDGKIRFAGGPWKLYSVYAAVSTPAVNPATEADWTYHLATLREWASARPESATARIALAEAYINYADYGRGSGYANTVTDAGWKHFNERNALAASALAEAAQLKEKCPFWYEAMQQLAVGQGWDKTQARELFEDAVAFEPQYYHYYREYANFLLPKWYGSRGEAAAFAEQVSNKVGGQQGKFLYFEIASLITCQCDSDDTDMGGLSWPKIKEGYAALGQLYGYSNLKINRFAHMAMEQQDRAAARQAFAMMGDSWDHTVWHNSQVFESARAWAMGQ